MQPFVRPARRDVALWLLLIAGVVVAMAVALLAGKYPVTVDDVRAVIWQRMTGTPSESVSPAIDAVVWQLRVPRLLAGMLVGASLSAAGAAYQTMFRNPLVSPDILGVSAGAGLGAVAAIYLGLPIAMVQLLAFVGGLMAVGIVTLTASLVRRHDPVLVLVLAGVAAGAFLGAGISLLKILADPYTQLPSITFWLMGGLNAVSLQDLLLALPWALAGLVPLVLLRWRVNLLSLSDDEARALGVNTRRLRGGLIVAATLMTASALSFTGIIGWVGLLIPHIARLLVGPEFSRLLPASCLLGAAFLLITDTLARTLVSIELPLGILTAIVGAPFFLYLLAKGGRPQ